MLGSRPVVQVNSETYNRMHLVGLRGRHGKVVVRTLSSRCVKVHAFPKRKVQEATLIGRTVYKLVQGALPHHGRCEQAKVIVRVVLVRHQLAPQGEDRHAQRGAQQRAEGILQQGAWLAAHQGGLRHHDDNTGGFGGGGRGGGGRGRLAGLLSWLWGGGRGGGGRGLQATCKSGSLMQVAS